MSESIATRRTELAKQGQTWRSISESSISASASFQRPAALFDEPMEISCGQLRGLCMVDETIVVHGTLDTGLSTTGGAP